MQSWLRTVAHRRAIDRIRSLEALRKRELRIGTRDHHSVDRDDDQRDALFLRPTLRIALADLSDKQRDAVVLRYFGERSTAEVASQLGITVGDGQDPCPRRPERSSSAPTDRCHAGGLKTDRHPC
ncbi:sigma-70 family RNA polymerase sigma factor [Curtobacterium flaccumfaciens]|nr:sigma-70 family RNA polymerase sigma factor [Curtobacterium flaccumfaciens]